VAFLNTDLRFVQPRASTRRTLARLRKPVFVERESTGPAAGRDDDDVKPGRTRRSESVPKVVLNIAAFETKIPRQ
jgi:hypothetical protein